MGGETQTGRKTTRRWMWIVVGVVLAAVAALVTVVLVSNRGGWADDWVYQRSTLTSQQQVAAYDAAMETARSAHARGTDGLIWARACRSTSYQVGASMGDDQQIGMLAGCADGLAAYWGDEE